MSLKRGHHLLLRLVIIILFIACFAYRARMPALADEVDFLLPIENWVRLGPQNVGLWHSPIYVWLLMGLGRVFSVTPAVFRMVGFFSILTATTLVYLSAKRLRPDLEEWRKTLLLGLSLLSPVALGSALLLDYDTTLLVATTALYFYLLVRYASSEVRERVVWREVVVFGAALGVCLLAKETTPLIYPLGFLIVSWMRLASFTQALVRAVLSGVLGCVIFLAVTWLWCKHYGLPLSAVFAMDLLGLQVHTGEPRPWGELTVWASIWVKLIPAIWIGLPLAFLFLARVPALLRANAAVCTIAIVVLAVIFAYTFGLRQLTYHFPKYMSPVLIWIPWLVLVPQRKETVPSAWVIGVLLWFLLVPIDPLGLVYARNAASLVQTLLVIGVPLAVWAMIRSLRPATLALLIAMGLSLSYCRSALLNQKSITYWYGDNAIREARHKIEQWKAKNSKGRIYVPTKDISWATRDLGVEYISKDPLGDMALTLCADKRPMLVVTRIREDSSLSRSPALERMRRCVGHVSTGVDIAYGSAYSAN